MLVALFKKGNDKEKQNIYDAYLDHTDTINNWDLIDSSAHQIVGGYLFERDRKRLYQLAKSKSLWERRISMIATYTFIKRDDFEDTLNLSAILLTDEEDLMHKAVGWMLRDPGPVLITDVRRLHKQLILVKFIIFFRQFYLLLNQILPNRHNHGICLSSL